MCFPSSTSPLSKVLCLIFFQRERSQGGCWSSSDAGSPPKNSNLLLISKKAILRVITIGKIRSKLIKKSCGF